MTNKTCYIQDSSTGENAMALPMVEEDNHIEIPVFAFHHLSSNVGVEDQVPSAVQRHEQNMEVATQD